MRHGAGIPRLAGALKTARAAAVEPLSSAEACECRELPAFPASDVAAVRRAFRDAASRPLRQAWLETEEPGFAPGVVCFGWRGESLLVFAELTDADIFSRAAAFNQRTWELGDTFEIFLRPAAQQPYVEFQVAPNNQRLQLRYPDAGAVERARQTGALEEFLVPGEAFHSATWVQAAARKWLVLAEIPARSVGEAPGQLRGRQWRFSFSRYDYTSGRREPVISSTSPHLKPDFHRQHEWGTMRFRQ